MSDRDCVFCTRHDQPATLFETPHYYIMPDKFPLLSGHVLIISKEHRRCHADAPIEELQELEEATQRVRRFLFDAYGKPVYISESGAARQTVFHAHLHLVPFPIGNLPEEVDTYQNVMPVEDWPAVREYFTRHGSYWYVELGERRYVADPYGPGLQAIRRMLVDSAGLNLLGEHGVVKMATPDDVREVNRRWDECIAARTTHDRDSK